jgi:hypothetical protein
VEFAVRTEQAAHQWKESLERVIANAKPSASASDTQDELGMWLGASQTRCVVDKMQGR